MGRLKSELLPIRTYTTMWEPPRCWRSQSVRVRSRARLRDLLAGNGGRAIRPDLQSILERTSAALTKGRFRVTSQSRKLAYFRLSKNRKYW
jgi:hypothetical protein